MRYNAWTFLSLALLVLGVAFWLYMSAVQGSGSDVGVYSVAIVLIGFGLLGTGASMLQPKTE